MNVLIKSAQIVNGDGIVKGDILVEEGIISRIGDGLIQDDAVLIDAAGKYVFPGFIDMHVHFRTPGREDKETIETGSRAAVKGGFTTVMCMPNTEPAIDTYEVAASIRRKAQRAGLLDVIPIGAFTRGREGKELSDIGLLKEAGCLALSDDGCSVADSNVFRRALEYAKKFGLLAISHCEDSALARGGVIRESAVSATWGIPGIPEIAESVIIARDIELARYLGVPVHIAHVSSARSVELIRRAREDGIAISAETCPHYLTFTIDDIAAGGFDARYKVNPPIGEEFDRQALIRGLKEGVIDCIATDHAPHTKLEKEGTFNETAFGMIGLEFAFSLCLRLVREKAFSLEDIARFLSLNPATLLKLNDRGKIAQGRRADLAIVDLDASWTVSEETIASKSRNTPFIGRTLPGVITHTMFGGRVVYSYV
jgi:dihydroorotase